MSDTEIFNALIEVVVNLVKSVDSIEKQAQNQEKQGIYISALIGYSMIFVNLKSIMDLENSKEFKKAYLKFKAKDFYKTVLGIFERAKYKILVLQNLVRGVVKPSFTSGTGVNLGINEGGFKKDSSDGSKKDEDAEQTVLKKFIRNNFAKGSTNCKYTFKNIVGLKQQKDKIKDGIVNAIKYPGLYGRTSKAILMFGPPGTGKTLLVKATVNEVNNEYPNTLRVNFFAPTPGDLKSFKFGGTEKTIKATFEIASNISKRIEYEQRKIASLFLSGKDSKEVGNEIRTLLASRSKDFPGVMELDENEIQMHVNKYEKYTKMPTDTEDNIQQKNMITEAYREREYIRVISALFFDEIDSVAESRDTGGELAKTTVNAFLQAMDGIGSADNIVVVGASNYPWKLDTAILSRFDNQIYVPPPTREDVIKVVDLLMNDRIKSTIDQFAFQALDSQEKEKKSLIQLLSDILDKKKQKGNPLNPPIIFSSQLCELDMTEQSIIPWSSEIYEPFIPNNELMSEEGRKKIYDAIMGKDVPLTGRSIEAVFQSAIKESASRAIAKNIVIRRKLPKAIAPNEVDIFMSLESTLRNDIENYDDSKKFILNASESGIDDIIIKDGSTELNFRLAELKSYFSTDNKFGNYENSYLNYEHLSKLDRMKSMQQLSVNIIYELNKSGESEAKNYIINNLNNGKKLNFNWGDFKKQTIELFETDDPSFPTGDNNIINATEFFSSLNLDELDNIMEIGRVSPEMKSEMKTKFKIIKMAHLLNSKIHILNEYRISMKTDKESDVSANNVISSAFGGINLLQIASLGKKSIISKKIEESTLENFTLGTRIEKFYLYGNINLNDISFQPKKTGGIFGFFSKIIKEDLPRQLIDWLRDLVSKNISYIEIEKNLNELINDINENVVVLESIIHNRTLSLYENSNSTGNNWKKYVLNEKFIPDKDKYTFDRTKEITLSGQDQKLYNFFTGDLDIKFSRNVGLFPKDDWMTMDNIGYINDFEFGSRLEESSDVSIESKTNDTLQKNITPQMTRLISNFAVNWNIDINVLKNEAQKAIRESKDNIDDFNEYNQTKDIQSILEKRKKRT